jgi:DNA topoisomerase IB
MDGLARSDPAGPGHTRRRCGRGWRFFDAGGEPVHEPQEVARIKALVIPPAWAEVWICADPRGHLQAVGTDVAGRRQYLYHDAWRRQRDVEKYARVCALGRRLAGVRVEVMSRLDETGLGRQRVLAAGVRMLDLGVFRVGGEEYAPDPDSDVDSDTDAGTFGLATLRRDHVRLRRGAVQICFVGKGAIKHTASIRDRALHRVCGSLLRRRGGGEDLLAFRDGREWCDVRAEHLNQAVKELAGERYSAKDLRTWNATVLAAVTLAAGSATGPPVSLRAAKRRERAAIEVVAHHLGNTPAVARGSYVDPRVIERFEAGRTVLPALRKIGADGDGPRDLDDAARAVIDRAVVRLLRSA